jgi:hypothetical protein
MRRAPTSQREKVWKKGKGKGLLRPLSKGGLLRALMESTHFLNPEFIDCLRERERERERNS